MTIRTWSILKSAILSLTLASTLGACGVTSTDEKKDDGAGKIAARSTDLVEKAISQTDIYCPTDYSFRTTRTPNAPQAVTVSAIVDVVHNCFSRTDKQAYCRFVGQEHYLLSGAQRNYLSSDTCGNYGLFDANRDNQGQPICLIGCDEI
jgi:hypothetical protein